jgi:site-specific DNA-methyltransferase (adenine-specific)
MGKEMKDIILGDCIEKMKNISSNSIDMILTDLPYGVTQNKWDEVIPFKKLWPEWNRVKKINTPIVLFGQGLFTSKIMNSNEKLWKYNLIWEKDRPSGFLNSKRMPLRSHEDIVIFYDKLPAYHPQMVKGNKNHKVGSQIDKIIKTNNNYGECKEKDNSEKLGNMKYPRSVLKFNKEHPPIHPTQKPVKLLEYLIKTYSNEGDSILDCCAGSGSTGVACMKLNRNYILIEKDQDYHTMINTRLKFKQEILV